MPNNDPSTNPNRGGFMPPFPEEDHRSIDDFYQDGQSATTIDPSKVSVLNGPIDANSELVTEEAGKIIATGDLEALRNANHAVVGAVIKDVFPLIKRSEGKRETFDFLGQHADGIAKVASETGEEATAALLKDVVAIIKHGFERTGSIEESTSYLAVALAIGANQDKAARFGDSLDEEHARLRATADAASGKMLYHVKTDTWKGPEHLKNTPGQRIARILHRLTSLLPEVTFTKGEKSYSFTPGKAGKKAEDVSLADVAIGISGSLAITSGLQEETPDDAFQEPSLPPRPVTPPPVSAKQEETIPADSDDEALDIVFHRLNLTNGAREA